MKLQKRAGPDTTFIFFWQGGKKPNRSDAAGGRESPWIGEKPEK
jgi:hypothetical protein